MRVFLVILLCLCSGCGMAIQTAMGWSDVETRLRTRERPVQVSTVPAGADVCRFRPDGPCEAVGVGPTEDTVRAEYEEDVETPSTLGLWVGSGLSFIVTGISIAMLPKQCGDNGVECPVIPWITTFLGGFGGIIDAMVAVIYPSFTGEEIAATKVVSDPKFTYRASKEGYQPVDGAVDISASDAIVLKLEPILEAPELALVDAARDEMIVTVAPLTSNVSLPWLDALGHRLHLDITGLGVRTVETGAVDRMLREANCTGDGCDVEIGRALAASHLVRARVTRLGDRCVLAAELIDLAREVSVAAAGSRGTCDDDNALEQLATGVARELLTGIRTGTSAP
ncbi:MAG: hypothetical protein RMA76_06875 [Deltaproteobacteria bacterium]